MTYLLVLITSLAISMAIIPVMVRFAPRFGMIDKPDSRKVHAHPIPRAGGVGIVLGSLVSMAMWLPMDALTVAYLFGSAILLIFGVWDDICELGHYAKFVGQLIAVAPVVYYGDLYVTHLPLMGFETIPDFIGKPFTIFALMGMINAINHSDGLDGLAGGMSLLSLSCMAYLAFLANGELVMLIAMAVIGGVFGFLRYNTYPAKVFMGDGGSQFLGFTVGFVVLLLIERINPALSPALPALLLGLPIIDILAVFVQRIYQGMNWFRATKNHIHHRLLELKFHHYEAVIIIYSIQAFFVVSAVFLGYESDFLILSLYIGVCALIFLFLIVAKNEKWHTHRRQNKSHFVTYIQFAKYSKLFVNYATQIVAIVIPTMFLGISVLASRIPDDFGFSAGALALILVLTLIFGTKESIALRAINYITAAFVVYLETKYMGNKSYIFSSIDFGLYTLLAIFIWLSVRYASNLEFKTSPTDFLVIFLVLIAGFISRNQFQQEIIGIMAIKLVILFYGCELIFAKLKKKVNSLNISALMTLSILSARSLI